MASSGVNVSAVPATPLCAPGSANHRQVARWSALFAGVVYGIYHQRSIRTHQRLDEVKRKYYNEESLIAKAKAAYLEKTLPPEKRAPGGGGESAKHGDDLHMGDLAGKALGAGNIAYGYAGTVISDPEDPKFDLEAYLTMKSAEEPK